MAYPIGPGAGPGVEAADILGSQGIGDKASGILGKAKGITTGQVGKFGGGMLAWWLGQKLLDTINQQQDIGIQRQGLRSQANMVTPESLYYQAALPQAQREESMAHQALMTQLTGGVLGPQLAKGEYQIGG